MESKPSDQTRMEATGASSKSKEGLWWRWTHGKSGTTASSSHAGSPYDTSSRTHNSFRKAAAARTPVSNGVRWKKRATRTPREMNSSLPTVGWSTTSTDGSRTPSPKFFSASATSSARSSRPSPTRTPKEENSSSSMAWSTTDSGGSSSSPKFFSVAATSSRNSRTSATRMPKEKNDSLPVAWSTSGDSGGSSSSPKFFSATATSSSRTSQTSAMQSKKKPTTSSSVLSVDPVVNCARAVLQDCMMKRKMEQNNARKRSIEGSFELESKEFGWHYDVAFKHGGYGIMSPGSSSSSDDELSQLSSMDLSFCTEKSERDCDSKLAKEELYRQILTGDLSSSPEFQCFSPMFEEKGLPIEVRYQLPLALGTANETSKECTICQLRYGIGDHIVTLPCEHFFHACCVDKWLWNHTSCPLCRTEVSLEHETKVLSTKHNFTECSPVDQERIRRQMRSSSQHAGFRPVVPVEIDQLELEVSRMAIDEGSEDEEVEPSYLVCPTPHLATNTQDHCSRN